MIPDDTQWPEWAEELRRRCLMLWSWLTNDRCECGHLWGDLLHGCECCERFGVTKVGYGCGVTAAEERARIVARKCEMSTAPKDGRKIILYGKLTLHSHADVWVAAWRGEIENDPDFPPFWRFSAPGFSGEVRDPEWWSAIPEID